MKKRLACLLLALMTMLSVITPFSNVTAASRYQSIPDKNNCNIYTQWNAFYDYSAKMADFMKKYAQKLENDFIDHSPANKPVKFAKRSDYSDPENWAYLEEDTDGKDIDIFFINPTVYMGDDDHYVWSEYDEKTKNSFVGSINMEKGIYDENARFFAPFYHQAAFNAYSLPKNEQKPLFDHVYSEVKDAFLYYMKHYNKGRPFILAGFSQGADMSIRLLKDCFRYRPYAKQLIACYAIGWRITEEELRQYPQIHFAKGADDTGVVIAFNTEAEGIEDSLLIPKGTKTLAINPLNWKTDSTMADKSLNLGACFTSYSGAIKSEIPELTGAYIDPERGSLIAVDIDPEEYPGKLFDNGIYHLYDYQFFYRNLQENVKLRTAKYLEKHQR